MDEKRERIMLISIVVMLLGICLLFLVFKSRKQVSSLSFGVGRLYVTVVYRVIPNKQNEVNRVVFLIVTESVRNNIQCKAGDRRCWSFLKKSIREKLKEANIQVIDVSVMIRERKGKKG